MKYQLDSVNLSQLGNPMGSELTMLNFMRRFNTLKEAKRSAEKDYGKPIEWKLESPGCWTSGDLGFVCYEVYAR